MSVLTPDDMNVLESPWDFKKEREFSHLTSWGDFIQVTLSLVLSCEQYNYIAYYCHIVYWSACKIAGKVSHHIAYRMWVCIVNLQITLNIILQIILQIDYIPIIIILKKKGTCSHLIIIISHLICHTCHYYSPLLSRAIICWRAIVGSCAVFFLCTLLCAWYCRGFIDLGLPLSKKNRNPCFLIGSQIT